MSEQYLKRILNAKVYDIAKETPLELAKILSSSMQNKIYIKREDMQDVFSFKIRGAYNKMAHLSDEAKKRGVIAASAGNHAQGVAYSARQLGCKATIVMPISTPEVKIQAVKRFGGHVVLHGDSFTDAYEYSLELQKEHDLTFVHPFDDPDVIAGQGTVGLEILRQHSEPLDAVFIPIGGGGLIAGVAVYIKTLRPETLVIGVETQDSNAMQRSLKSDRRLSLNDVGLFSDGTAVKQVGTETFKLTKSFVDEVITVNTDEICAAIKDVFQDTRSVLEPSGALALAGAKKYIKEQEWKKKSVVAIASGANMNFDRLRFVSERADVGQNKEAVLAATIPEVKGSFKQLCSAIGNRSVTEFNYRISSLEKAHIFIGVQTSGQEEIEKVIRVLERKKFQVTDLSGNDLAKTHIRYMVGGTSNLANNEILYRFEFPERPGALKRFLENMSPEWNISLFHYRNMGADYGKVLVGFQVPPTDKTVFKAFLDTTGYPYVEETQNPVYQMFLSTPSEKAA